MKTESSQIRSVIYRGVIPFILLIGIACRLIAGEMFADSPLNLVLRRSVETQKGSGNWRETEQKSSWNPAQTAVVICDMWNRHWCESAHGRVAEMAPRMNQVVRRLRDRGALIIHCPSDTMEFYKDHPDAS